MRVDGKWMGIRSGVRVACAGVCVLLGCAAARGQAGKPEKLECESLVTPLGMDVEKPLLSWQLRDSRDGARQTAYELQVASSEAGLTAGKADVWDSGKVESGASIGVAYGGPQMQASKRYFWRVLVWDRERKPYPASDVSWWETGLLKQENWKAKWIGYEESEERAVRESGAKWITNADTGSTEKDKTTHAFRFRFSVNGAVRRANLYATGEDTTAAWVNGKQVMETSPMPAYQHLPWKTYFVRDVTGDVKGGANVLAVEVIRYGGGRGAPDISQTPMNTLLYVDKSDGTTEIFKSGDAGWKGAWNASGNWQQAGFDDSTWRDAIPFVGKRDGFEGAVESRPWPTGTVKSLRRNFEVTKPVASVRVYATALGSYKLFVNGKPVGAEILAPGWTDFREKVVYQAYDVSDLVQPGQNAIGALLAPGWYSTPLQWLREGNNYGATPPAVRVQMRIEYRDGSVDEILSDDSWRADSSAIRSAEIYDGETYDARKVQKGWDTAGFADGAWRPVEVIQPNVPKIVWQYFQPIAAERTLTANMVAMPSPGVYVFDFGQNFSGVVRIRTKGAAGTDVKLRFAEVLNPDGTMYVENLRTAKATDHFILAGKGEEEFEPQFTYHGFRYAEVSGVKEKPDPKDVQAVVFHTDAPFTAELRTGSEMLNKLWSNIVWGQRSNFVGVPTDCPQRDERLGWSADAQVFWRTASYNMDLTAFSRKFSGDLLGTQVGAEMYGIFAPGTDSENPGYGTGWSDAGVIVPWTSWIQTGDAKIVEENWEGMRKYLDAIHTANPDFLWKKNYGIPFADWLSPEGVTPVDLIATAYWAYDVTLMKQMAAATGRTAEAAEYGVLFDKIKEAFGKAYVGPDGFVGGVPPPPVFASGTGTKLSDQPVETQTGYVVAINMKLLTPELEKLAGQRLADRIAANHGQLGTGFLGTPYLLAALTNTGHLDVAYQLLLNTEYPSWGYLVEHGATTMWERWNGDQMRGDPSMNSYNHYAYGAVADWVYRYSAGIDTVAGDPGFHTIYLHPNFDRKLGSVDFSYQSQYGAIRSAWSVTGDKVAWKVTIPANTSGELPAEVGGGQLRLDGKELAGNSRVHSKHENGATVYEVPAGTYEFESTLR
ncbi:MAG TPA: family 78 glycoside hydrolase catalytic domain [Candidatus Acidoferrum sp.]